MSPDLDLSVEQPPEYAFIAPPYANYPAPPGAYPYPQNPPQYVLPAVYVTPNGNMQYAYPPQNVQPPPPYETVAYPADPSHLNQYAPSSPPQPAQNTSQPLYPSIDSPPREKGKPPRPPNSPPQTPTFEGATTKSTSPKTEQQKAKNGFQWLGFGKGSKAGEGSDTESEGSRKESTKGSKKEAKEKPELPLQIVTLAINKDVRVIEERRQKEEKRQKDNIILSKQKQV